MALSVHITSFGYGHGPAPDADVTVDVRPWFRDPHVTPHMRELTGRDTAVMSAVLGTPGVMAYLEHLHGLIGVLVRQDIQTVRVAVGCVGGRHRSAVIARHLAALGRTDGWTVDVHHRDIEKDVLVRAAAAAAEEIAP